MDSIPKIFLRLNDRIGKLLCILTIQLILKVSNKNQVWRYNISMSKEDLRFKQFLFLNRTLHHLFIVIMRIKQLWNDEKYEWYPIIVLNYNNKIVIHFWDANYILQKLYHNSNQYGKVIVIWLFNMSRHYKKWNIFDKKNQPFSRISILELLRYILITEDKINIFLQ